MMAISTIVSRLLQSLEFFRSGWGRWITLLFNNSVFRVLFLVPCLIYGFVRFCVSLFTRFCSFISDTLSSLHTPTLQVGGVDIFAFANSVLPLDELIGLLTMWFGVCAACATIRFVRAAWAAIPLKAT